MKNILYMVIGMLAGSTGALAQSGGDAAVGAGLMLGMNAVFDVKRSPKIPPDQIKGKCSFDGGRCPGAQIVVFNRKAEKVGNQTLSSLDGFTFMGLPEGTYTLKVSYPRYHLLEKVIEVSTGAEVSIEFKK